MHRGHLQWARREIPIAVLGNGATHQVELVGVVEELGHLGHLAGQHRALYLWAVLVILHHHTLRVIFQTRVTAKRACPLPPFVQRPTGVLQLYSRVILRWSHN